MFPGHCQAGSRPGRVQSCHAGVTYWKGEWNVQRRQLYGWSSGRGPDRGGGPVVWYPSVVAAAGTLWRRPG